MVDSIFLFLANHSLWVTVFICAVQVWFVWQTYKKLQDVKLIFPANVVYIRQGDDLPTILAQDKQGKKVTSLLLKGLIDELNDYIRKNEGTTDFSIIQHKTERIAKSKFEDATATLSFPTYIGLMGTFLGVFVGLYCFNVSDGGDLVNDDKIAKLIHGVLISMSTSLIGLLLMTLSNWYAVCVRKNLNIEKNVFYRFIQNELMPELGTSMVSALSKLRSTITKFEPAFDGVLDRFQTTFDKCTTSFGDAFNANVDIVAKAVFAMGKNIEQINQNVIYQQKLLTVLQSAKMNVTLDKFILASERFDSLAESMSLFNQVKDEIVISIQQLIDTQHRYNASLEIPQSVAERLNEILNRVTTFEESVNQLGEHLGQEQIVGNSVINSINKHMDLIDQKHAIAVNYADIAEEKLKELYTKQTDSISKLNDQYSISISNHADEFERMLKQVQERLDEKWKLFTRSLDDSFNMSEVNTDFDYLKQLDVIEKHLSELKEVVEKKDVSFTGEQRRGLTNDFRRKNAESNMEGTSIDKFQYMERLDSLEKMIAGQKDEINNLNTELEKANESIVHKMKKLFKKKR